jgi:ABC-type Fe3+-hydroxamate transport system substrate-binding protein
VNFVPARLLFVCLVGLSALSSACSSSESGAPTSASASPSASTLIGPTGSSPECSAAVEVAAVLAQAKLPTADALANLPTVVRQLHDVVPDELGADVDTVAETLDGFVAVLSRFDFDSAAASADPQAAADLAALNTPEFSDSIARIQQWVDDSCA